MEQPRSEKWNKQMYIFEKGVFRSGPGLKSGVEERPKPKNGGEGELSSGGAFGRHIPVLP